MASETSELTFVRCPSCRSLVPASAHRCRICNNTLEGSGKGGEGDAGRATGRVRQKTISANAEDLVQAQTLAAESEGAPAVTTHQVTQDAPHEDAIESDPLGAYLQDLEDESEVPVGSNPVATQSKATRPAADELDDLLEEFEDLDDEPEVAKAAPAKTAARHLEPAPHDDLEDGLFDDFGPLPTERPAAGDRVDRKTPNQTQRGAEQVAKPPLSRPPLPHTHTAKGAFNPPRSERSNAPAGGRPQKDQKPQGVLADSKGQGDQRGHQSRAAEERTGARAPERARDSGKRQDGDAGARPNARSEGVASEQASVASPGPKTGRMRPGRLFGWLVSFESADGRAIELREGKFFVTGTSIRGTDLVIEDPSISTPHAMMSVNAERGLLIQDLMSDRGIFVRAGERGQYRREENLVEVKHGDWIRFGDVEFLVTIVPSGK